MQDLGEIFPLLIGPKIELGSLLILSNRRPLIQRYRRSFNLEDIF